MNNIEAIIALFLFLLVYLNITERIFRNPRRCSSLIEKIFKLRSGIKIKASFYIEYEILDINNFPDEKRIQDFSVSVLEYLFRKDEYKNLERKKVGKKASRIVKRKNDQKEIGKIRIVIEKIEIFEEKNKQP
ncbi:MAG: hypothetical protein WC322_01760 [Candidatus Paceibacterota bacterium]|jgi:hypothetical protein|nr:hypothetical protein [Candidatus Paceibacterota bacterium]